MILWGGRIFSSLIISRKCDEKKSTGSSSFISNVTKPNSLSSMAL